MGGHKELGRLLLRGDRRYRHSLDAAPGAAEGGMSMSYLLFIAIGYCLVLAGAKVGVMVDDTTWLCLAILTGAEVISWRCKK